ncbi:MAG: OmpA family protein [Mariprofundaceae bacterium]
MLALFLIAEAAHAGDVAGGKDYPMIGRFDGSNIAYYKAVDFDAYQFITGPVKAQGKVGQGETVEGRKIRIAYHMPEGTTVVEASRNFEIKMKEAGFDIFYQCNAKECGRTAFTRTAEVLPMPGMLVDPWNFKYVAAKKSRAEGDIYATLLTSLYSGKTRAQLIVVETKTMENKMVDADKMAKAIAETGSIALYGIYFDTDKASVKPESKAALGEIAKLMNKQPALKLVVVGHTDNVGKLEYNMDLSRRRAQAVKQALVADYGIAESRLKAWGVGYLSPVATNQTEEGRAKNRRVALVEL